MAFREKAGRMARQQRIKKLAEERWRRDLLRRSRKEKQRRREAEHDSRSPPEGYRSKVLDAFCEGRYKNPRFRPRGNVSRFTLPETFSFSRNPNETISILKRIAKDARACRVPRIILDHRRVKDIGLGADTILGLLLNEVQREASSAPRAYIRGYKPKNPAIRKMMDEVGSVRAINDFEGRIEIELKSSAHVFRFHHRDKMGEIDPSEPDLVARTIKKFVDHLNECLGLIGKELTASGLQRLGEYVSEVISNANEHSGIHEWIAVGYIDNNDSELVYRSVIVSIGKTIAENFLGLQRDSYAWRCIEGYVNAHKQHGLFSETWREQDLLTVVALQGDISSLNKSKDDTRGQGTVDLIEFFQMVHDECAKDQKLQVSTMHILSGSSLIWFDGTYRMQKDQTGRAVLAFNAQNSLSELPNSKYVTRLAQESFPGALISVTLPLLGSSIQSAKEGKNDGD